MIKKKLIIEKAKFNDEEGKYILYGYSETERGSCYRRLFRGTKKECLEKRKNLMILTV